MHWCHTRLRVQRVCRLEGCRGQCDVAWQLYARRHFDSAFPSEPDEASLAHEHIASLLERLRREPALRAWVMTAPTGALATLGVVLDDNELVLFLERIEALDERHLPGDRA